MKIFKEQASCVSTDPEAFFTEDDSGTYTNINMLKKICGTCPAVDECLDYALKHDVKGYWGNTTEWQRANIRGKRNIRAIPLRIDLYI